MNQKLLQAIQTHQALVAMRDAEIFLGSATLPIALAEKIQKQSDIVLDLFEEVNPGFKSELAEIARTIS